MMRPPGNPDASGKRDPDARPDDDDATTATEIDEETLNGFDDDGDGQIDEDFGQVGNQMMVLTKYDNTRLAQENFPDHTPMNLQFVQQTYQWENDQVDDFVGFEYTITNIGVTDVENVYIGFFSDCDIAARSTPGGARRRHGGAGIPRRGRCALPTAALSRSRWGTCTMPPRRAVSTATSASLFLGHDIDPTGRQSAEFGPPEDLPVLLRQRPFEQGGDPTNDDERYQLLSVPRRRDGNTQPGKQADFRFLVSAGPFSGWPPTGT